MTAEPLTTGSPVRAPRAPHAPRPNRTTPPRRRPTRPGAAPSRARLTALPAPRAHAPRTPFVLLVVALLGLGLLALLLLNTASAQDAFRLSDLQRQSKALADQEQSLSRQAASLSDPASVAAAAAKLGMVPGAVPIFLGPGQKVPVGQIIGGMVIVPAPRATQPTHPASTSAVTTPVKKPAAANAATKSPATTTKPATGATKPATAASSPSAAQLKFLQQMRDFNNYANWRKNHPGQTPGTSTGSHP